jgi:hypothetical protein
MVKVMCLLSAMLVAGVAGHGAIISPHGARFRTQIFALEDAN